MENFIVSARKYRPATFESVVGQHSITSTLKNAIKSNHIAQAFLFTGPRGVGKTTCARIFAKTINCEHLNENFEPCDQCESCTSFNKSNSFNIHELDAASNNSVEDIRRLVEQVRIPPQVGKYKVYIIDEVHMLSQAAFNAFLKTLEEPPAYAKFILATTEKHKIIPTILSRCQIYDFNRITLNDISNHLIYVANQENVDFELAAMHVIAQKADGALRDALSIFDQIVSFSGNKITYQNTIENLNVLDFEFHFKLVDTFLHGDIPNSLLIFDEIISKGFDGHHFMNGLASHLRNLLVGKDASTIKLLETSDDIKALYLKQAAYCDLRFLVNALDICSKVDLNYKSASNKRLLIEISLMDLCRLNKEIESAKADLSPLAAYTPTKPIVPQPLQVATPTTIAQPPAPAVPQPIVEPKPINQNNTPTPTTESVAAVESTLPVNIAEPTVSLLGNKKFKTISIKEEEEEEEKLEVKINYDEEVSKSYTSVEKEINFDELWVAIEKYKEELRLEKPAQCHALLKEKIRLEPNNNVVLTVSNETLFTGQDKYNLVVSLKETLNNQQLQLSTEVVTERISNTNSPKEIYQRMVETNPEVQNLSNTLNLQFEY